MTFLNDRSIRILEHPAKSPDMSPIEHIWQALKERVWKENVNLEKEGRKLTK